MTKKILKMKLLFEWFKKSLKIPKEKKHDITPEGYKVAGLMTLLERHMNIPLLGVLDENIIAHVLYKKISNERTFRESPSDIG